MRECLLENKQRRALYERRKEAAVKIATWYKEILTERRNRYLIESCRRMQSFFTAAIARSKLRVRRTCALRILDFMQREVNNTQISAAVQKLRRCTIVVQRSWRTRVAAREAQVTMLTLQLTKLETRLLSYNRYKATGNNASVFAATARRTVPLHEELKMTLRETANWCRRRGGGTEISTRRRVKMDDEEEEMTPQQMLFLNTLTVRLPRWIKDQVEASAMLQSVQ